ncbi:MAG: fasciclin domain-containing protein [Saprospiraceae bacterium]|nr:fasciclin domain-containing protein [Saprospiraceae bacterium]
MKKHVFWSFLLALPLAFTLVSCDDDDPVQPEPPNIVEIAADDPQFSILVSALQRTGLDATVQGLSDATVFAPTNSAFNALGVDLNALTDEALSEILLYHVIAGTTITSGEIADGQTYVNTAATTGPDGTALSVMIEKDATGVSVNGSINVVAADITGSNGVIHVVDAVIMPLDIVGHAVANSNFTELVGALGAASGDLVSILSGDGPFTVFAPLNSAFEAISDVVAGLDADQLASVLTYHVVGGANVRSTQLTDGQQVSTVNGSSFTVNLGAGATITDSQGNTVEIILTDVQATNGVIHVLDAVILPQL